MSGIYSFFIWVWIFTLLLILFAIANVLIFLQKDKYDPILKWMTRILLTLIGIRVETDFSEKLDSKGTYLFLSNHVNVLDPFLLYGYIPTYVRGVESGNQFNWPIYGTTITRMGNIPIDRDNARKAIQSIHKAAEELRNGISIVIFPEGHRTPDGKLKQLKRGSFILAKEGGRDIVPIIISGGWEITRRGSWYISPGKIKLKFGRVIGVKDFKGLSSNELRELCLSRLEELI